MKRIFTVRLPQACTEDWEMFVPKGEGRHCQVCSKVVVDFTCMSDNEIVTYLAAHSGRICGRLGKHQLKSYALGTDQAVRPGFGLLKAGLFCLFLLVTSKPAEAKPLERNAIALICHQDGTHESMTSFTISGQVISKADGMPMPGVNVVVKGTSTGTVTDAEGNFKIGPVESGSTLMVQFIGYETAEYIIPENPPLNLQLALEEDAAMLGEVVVVVGQLNIEDSLYTGEAKSHSLWNKVRNMFAREPKNQ